MIQIRPATLADCPALARVQVDSYRTAYAGMFPPAYLEHFTYEEQAQDWRDLLASGTTEILLVAEAQGEITGYILARPVCAAPFGGASRGRNGPEPQAFSGFDAEIVALHVQRSAQRRGAGRRLLGEAARALRACGCRSAMLWTLKANPVRGWYEKLAGRLVGERSWMVDDWEIIEVAYGWEDLGVLEKVD